MGESFCPRIPKLTSGICGRSRRQTLAVRGSRKTSALHQAGQVLANVWRVGGNPPASRWERVIRLDVVPGQIIRHSGPAARRQALGTAWQSFGAVNLVWFNKLRCSPSQDVPEPRRTKLEPYLILDTQPQAIAIDKVAWGIQRYRYVPQGLLSLGRNHIYLHFLTASKDRHRNRLVYSEEKTRARDVRSRVDLDGANR